MAERNPFCILILFFFVTLVGAAPARADRWSDASEGRSSFRNLGAEYSVPVTVEPIEGARVVLVNEPLAKALGLTPQQGRTLEEEILKRFALTTTSSSGDVDHRSFFATRYLDYPREMLKREGNPLGDGRNVWAGEIQIPQPDGRILYLDVSVKGAGRTPLSRKKKLFLSKQHSDGLQAMSEAVRSYIASEALAANGVATTRDLAVIEIPVAKTDTLNGTNKNAALSVRVGEQTRLGHLDYANDSSPRYRKMLDYVITRQQGLPIGQQVNDSNRRIYLETVGENLGRQHAIYHDLGFLHGSPTAGNITSSGHAIDFGTIQTLDANHPGFKGPYSTNFGNQKLNTLAQALESLRNQAPFPILSSNASSSNPILVGLVTAYDDEIVVRRLERLGLTTEQIQTLSYDTKKKFLNSSLALEVEGKYTRMIGGQKIYPVAFDVNEILGEAFSVLSLPEAEKAKAWEKTLLNTNKWRTLEAADLEPSNIRYGQPAQSFKEATELIKAELLENERQGRIKFEPTDIVARAREIAAKKRPSSTFPNFNPLLKKISEGKSTARENTAAANELIETLVDRRLGSAVTSGTQPLRGLNPGNSNFPCAQGYRNLATPR